MLRRRANSLGSASSLPPNPRISGRREAFRPCAEAALSADVPTAHLAVTGRASWETLFERHLRCYLRSSKAPERYLVPL